eukprot:scaffold2066_cov68-Cyclotella_meneghiniana.AAC.17
MPSVSTVVHYPLERPLVTSIYDPNQSYSKFAQFIIESIYQQSKLLELLKSIHPRKLTAYQLLFGASHGLIVKPTWAQHDDVTDGCLDINVTLHPCNQDELFPLSTPGLSILRTLPRKYTDDVQGPRSVLELDMVFFRIRKFSNHVTPFTRNDELTKVILIEEHPRGRFYAHSEIKDWDQEDKDCVLPSTWISDFNSTEAEDAMITGDWGVNRILRNLAGSALKKQYSNALVVTKHLMLKETSLMPQRISQVESTTKKKKTAAKTTSSRRLTSSQEAVEQDVATVDEDKASRGKRVATKKLSNTKHLHRFNVTAQPAKSLPMGWKEQSIPRLNGKGPDKYYFSPKDNIKLRSLVDVKLMIEKLEETSGNESKAWSLARKEKQDKKRKLEKVNVNNNDEHALSPKKKNAKSSNSNVATVNDTASEDVVTKISPSSKKKAIQKKFIRRNETDTVEQCMIKEQKSST